MSERPVEEIARSEEDIRKFLTNKDDNFDIVSDVDDVAHSLFEWLSGMND